jgi:hypothetical protein
MSKKVLMAVAVLGACVAFAGCSSDDGDDSSNSGNGSGLGGLLGKLGGDSSGTGDTGGGETGGGDTGGGDTGGGDTGGGDTGGGASGGGIGCEAACTLIVTCLNSACGSEFTTGDCTPECEGVESGIPLSVESSCEDVAALLEIGSFQDACGEVETGDDGDDTGGGSTGGGGSGDTCCNFAQCASRCVDQACGIACMQQHCGADGSLCAVCESWTEADAQACFGGQLPQGG